MTDDTIEERYNKIKEFESKIGPRLNYEKLVGKDLWDEYKERRERLLQALDDNQKFCNQLKETILKKTNE